MQSDDAVDLVFTEYTELIEAVGTKSPSTLTALNRVYPKHILIAAASSLEEQVKVQILPDLFERYGNSAIREFIATNVLKRGYHSLFDWNANTASKLFSAFGSEAKDRSKEYSRMNSTFSEGQQAFMQLGRLRNELVHNDYASRSVSVTPDDVHDMYLKAREFINLIEEVAFSASSA